MTYKRVLGMYTAHMSPLMFDHVSDLHYLQYITLLFAFLTSLPLDLNSF